jgi:hypothetical protein
MLRIDVRELHSNYEIERGHGMRDPFSYPFHPASKSLRLGLNFLDILLASFLDQP